MCWRYKSVFVCWQVDGKTNPKIQSFFLESFPIYCAHFSKDGEQVIMGSKHKSFKYLDMIGGKIVNVPIKGEQPVMTFGVFCVHFSLQVTPFSILPPTVLPCLCLFSFSSLSLCLSAFLLFLCLSGDGGWQLFEVLLAIICNGRVSHYHKWMADPFSYFFILFRSQNVYRSTILSLSSLYPWGLY